MDEDLAYVTAGLLQYVRSEADRRRICRAWEIGCPTGAADIAVRLVTLRLAEEHLSAVDQGRSYMTLPAPATPEREG